MSGLTLMTLAIYEKDPEAWGVGAELFDGEEVYHFFSYYLPRSEFPSKRRVIHYMLSEMLPRIKEGHDGATCIATLSHFGNRFEELRRKSAMYTGGKWVAFRKVRQVKRSTVFIAVDAVKRRSSISERLIDDEGSKEEV